MLIPVLALLAGAVVGFLSCATYIARYRRKLDAAFPEPLERAADWESALPYPPGGDARAEEMQRELLARYGREFAPAIREQAMRELRGPVMLGRFVIRVRP